MTQLSGKVALVTGASAGSRRGDGASCSPSGVQQSSESPATPPGWRGVRRHARRQLRVGGHHLGRGVRAGRAGLRRAFGRLDVLANVAGFHQMRHTVTMTDEDWDADLAVNLNGPFYLCRAALPHLLETRRQHRQRCVDRGRGGRGVFGRVLRGQARADRADPRAGRGVHQGEGCGSTPSARVACRPRRPPSSTRPENADWDLIMRIASPRGFMETDDVAKTIAFLASDDAAAIHGAVYRVDNGKGAG